MDEPEDFTPETSSWGVWTESHEVTDEHESWHGRSSTMVTLWPGQGAAATPVAPKPPRSMLISFNPWLAAASRILRSLCSTAINSIQCMKSEESKIKRPPKAV